MPAPDYPTLYEFERLISATLAGVFNDANILPKSIVDAPEFQKDRPRVEVYVTPGAAMGHYILDAQSTRRENGWHGALSLKAVTWPEITVHSAYVAAVRNVAATLDRLDLTTASVPLLYHEITRVVTAGTTPHTDPAAGEYDTQLHYNFIFAILPDAWPGGLFQG